MLACWYFATVSSVLRELLDFYTHTHTHMYIHIHTHLHVHMNTYMAAYTIMTK